MPENVSSNLFSQGALRFAQYKTGYTSQPSRRVGGLEAETYKAIDRAVSSIGAKYAQAQIAENRRRERFEESQFIAASALGLSEFDYGLKRELSNFYRSDGEEVLPAQDYRKEIMGGSLAYDDFVSDTGKRRSYREVVEAALDRYIGERKKGSPTPIAEGRADLRMREAKVKSLIQADIYDRDRHGVKLTNNLNTIVRAYKETIAKSKGFSPDVFATHVESLAESIGGAGEYVDAGTSSNLLREAVKDLVGVSVAEAATQQDNEAAIRVLAQTSILDNRATRDAMAGLSWKDKRLLTKYRNAYKKAASKYPIGSPLPSDRGEYFNWALSQLDAKQLSGVQERAIKSFQTQTSRVRSELDARIDGAVSSISHAAMNNSGFRESMLRSFDQMAAQLSAVYPKDIYPEEYKSRLSSLMVARALIHRRKELANTPTRDLPALGETLGGVIYEDLKNSLGEDNIAPLPITKITKKYVNRYAQRQVALRQADPFSALQSGDKHIERLERRLSVGDYSAESDRVVDQQALKSAVFARSKELGMPATFLDTTTRKTIEHMVTVGNIGDAYVSVKNIERKYGSEIFNNYVRPEILAMKGAKDLAPLIAMNDASKAEVLLGNITTFKSIKNLPGKGSAGTPNVRYSELLRDIRSDPAKSAPIEAFSTGLLGFNAEALELSNRLLEATAMAAVVGEHRGKEDKTAIADALDMVVTGLGTVVGTGDEMRIIPPAAAGVMTPAQFERLNHRLYQTDFLNTEVLPYLELEDVKERDRSLFRSREGELRNVLSDRGRTQWVFNQQGFYPTDSSELYGGQRAVYRSKKGGFFGIGYERVADILEGSE